MSQKGYVYILTNPSMPGLVKIGKTTRDVFKRSLELYQTGVPRPFTVFYSVFAPDCHTLELHAHAHLDEFRVSPDREFFELPKHDAMQMLDDLLREQVEEWLEDFIPDSYIVHSDEHVDIGGFKKSVYDTIRPSSMCPPDFAELLYQIEGKELAPALARMEEIIAKRRAAWKDKQAELKVVGE